MLSTQFKLPTTKLCVVVWYRNNQKNETLLPTPQSNQQLVENMLAFKVGKSEIRAVKPIETNSLIRHKI